MLSSLANTSNIASEVVRSPTAETGASETTSVPQGHVNPGFIHSAATNDCVVYANVNDLQISINTADRYSPDPTSTLRTADLMEYVKKKKRNGPNHELNMEHEVGLVFCLIIF